MSEGQAVLGDDRLQLAVDGERGSAAVARKPHVLTPRGQIGAAFLDGCGFLIGNVIDFAAESVEGGHGVALGFRKKNECQGEVGRALACDRSALLRHGGSCGRRRWRRGYSVDMMAGSL